MEPRARTASVGGRAALATLVVTLATFLGTGAQADVIGTPRCEPGSHGVWNPHHGSGWCEPSPCESDADCAPSPISTGEPMPFCRVTGVCIWNVDRAVAPCTTEGAACGGSQYSDSGACRVRAYCVPANLAATLPAPPGGAPLAGAPAAEPVAPERVEPTAATGPDTPPAASCACGAGSPRAAASGALLVAGLCVARFRPRRAR